MSINFTNKTNEDFSLWFIDSNGKTIEKGNVMKKSNKVLSTNPGYVWMLKKENLDKMCIYQVPIYLDSTSRVSILLQENMKPFVRVCNSKNLEKLDIQKKEILDNLKSTAGKSLTMKFTNISADSVTLYWINVEGNQQFFHTIAPEESKKVYGESNNYYILSKFHEDGIQYLG